MATWRPMIETELYDIFLIKCNRPTFCYVLRKNGHSLFSREHHLFVACPKGHLIHCFRRFFCNGYQRKTPSESSLISPFVFVFAMLFLFPYKVSLYRVRRLSLHTLNFRATSFKISAYCSLFSEPFCQSEIIIFR